MSTALYSAAMTTPEQPTKRQRTGSGDVRKPKTLAMHDVDLSSIEVRRNTLASCPANAFELLIGGSAPHLTLTPVGEWLAAPFKMDFAKAYETAAVRKDVVELTVSLPLDISDIWKRIDGRFRDELAKHIPNAAWKSILQTPSNDKFLPNLKLQIKLDSRYATALAVKRLDGTVEVGSGLEFFQEHCKDLPSFEVFAEVALASIHSREKDGVITAGLCKPVCRRVVFKELAGKRQSAREIDWDDAELRYILSH
jgi:hypothetical protein